MITRGPYCIHHALVSVMSCYIYYGLIDENTDFNGVLDNAKKEINPHRRKVVYSINDFFRKYGFNLTAVEEYFNQGEDEIYLAKIQTLLNLGIPIIAIHDSERVYQEIRDENPEEIMEHAIVLTGITAENFIMWDPFSEKWPNEIPQRIFKDGWQKCAFFRIFLKPKKRKVIKRKVDSTLEEWIYNVEDRIPQN